MLSTSSPGVHFEGGLSRALKERLHIAVNKVEKVVKSRDILATVCFNEGSNDLPGGQELTMSIGVEWHYVLNVHLHIMCYLQGPKAGSVFSSRYEPSCVLY